MMIKSFFIKHDQRIKKVLGCDRATLILDRLEFYARKQPKGFYKFLEPCSHKLYKRNDSWTELLGCHRTSFWRAFSIIGKKHPSKSAFDQAEDKFDGKLYASYYDRYSNRMFFIRNHEGVIEFFNRIGNTSTTCVSEPKKQIVNSLGTEQNARSYMESKKTSLELSRDNSHASADQINNKNNSNIAQQMMEIWSKTVNQPLVILTPKRIAFLKRALADKFEHCLKKWESFCQRVASSKFLMGEIKSSFKATLDWVLKFEVIQKIQEGAYGVGDRSCAAPIDHGDLGSHIFNLDEPEEAKSFRRSCLSRVGANVYVSWFKGLMIDLEGKILKIAAPTGFVADYLSQTFSTDLRVILCGLEEVSGLEVWVIGKDNPRLRLSRNMLRKSYCELRFSALSVQQRGGFEPKNVPNSASSDRLEKAISSLLASSLSMSERQEETVNP